MKLLDLKLQDNETRLHFIWKVYKYQEDTGNLTNEEAGVMCREQLNENYDESAYRKLYQYFSNMWKEVKTEYVNEEALLKRIEQIEQREDEIYKKGIRAKDWLREKRKYLRDEARVEALKDAFSDAYINTEDVVFNKYESKHSGNNSAVLMLSDWHVGIEIDNYWNTYNSEIFKKRLETILFKTFKYAEKNDIGTLYVTNLGDVVSGAIHATTRLAEEMDVLDQVMLVCKSMVSFLKDLSDFGLNVKYLSVCGNHDRLNKNYKEHIEKESFNKVIDWHILDKVNDDVLDIEFITNELDDGIGHFVIDGNDYFTVHGHQDSINSVITNMTMASGIIPKAVFMGHYHHKQSITSNTSKVFVNGSLVGVDTFAKDKRYFSSPSQSLIVLDDNDIVDIELNLQ